MAADNVDPSADPASLDELLSPKKKVNRRFYFTDSADIALAKQVIKHRVFACKHGNYGKKWEDVAASIRAHNPDHFPSGPSCKRRFNLLLQHYRARFNAGVPVLGGEQAMTTLECLMKKYLSLSRTHQCILESMELQNIDENRVQKSSKVSAAVKQSSGKRDKLSQDDVGPAVKKLHVTREPTYDQ